MMEKRTGLLVLLCVYTTLLASCGLEYRIGFIVAAAAATTSSVNTNRATTTTTCGAGSEDDPQCMDPLSYTSNPDDTEKSQSSSAKNNNISSSLTKENKKPIICDTGDCPTAKKRTRFQSGDIIELYNTESRDIQIVFPSIVKGRDAASDGGGFTVTKTTDGKEVKNIPEKFLHMYEPYTVGSEVLCNIGEFKPARPIIVRCTVLDYDAAAERGAMVLQGHYSVQVHATKANEEYVTELPVWKLQRRYLAGGVTATA